MRPFIIALLIFTHFYSMGQLNFAIGNYYRYEIEPAERYYKELKNGFDQEFYTPLVMKLKGNISSCTIEQIIPEKEAENARKYKEYKAFYDREQFNKSQQTKKEKRKQKKSGIQLLTPLRNSGYDTYSLVYRLNENRNLETITLNEVILYDYNETEIRNPVALYALTWKDNLPEALYYQGRSIKEKNSMVCAVSFFDYYKKQGYTQHLHFSGKTAVDTSEKNYLKINPKNRLMPADTGNNVMEMQTMHRKYKNGNSSESGFYVLQSADTLYKFKQYYNTQGLLVKRIVYDRKLLSARYDDNIETEVFDYTYDNEGKPTSLSYTEGISEPVTFKLKFIMPDNEGNSKRMQVYNQYDVLLREVGWHIHYRNK